MEKGWTGLPYHSISEHYKRIFGEKIYKIPVSVVDDCPNRMGLKGMKTCSFCDVWGSAARSESFTLTLDEQIEKFKGLIAKRYNSKNFLVYFQAYTNTFTKTSALRQNFEQSLKYDFVKGFVVGTRPDCLSPAVLNLWQEFHEKSFVSVELGVQSFYDEHLNFMQRGHTADDSIKAIYKITGNTTVDLGIHLIFGSPNETDEQIIQTAKICNDLPITNIKLHNLHVLKNTELEKWHAAGQFEPISQEAYTEKVKLFLSYLKPHIAVHRLAAFASRWEELVAPKWTANKMGTHQAIIDELRLSKTFQGCLWNPQNQTDRDLFEQMKLRVEYTVGI
ncbi:MAG: TIGR01212 family radical SAM protein [Bdellovibrio sp.]|nr:TIGR01212 family radical SAM protein [Bdellovibrio sp.]